MKNILKALAKVQASMPTVRQDGANPFHKSKYATLAECWNTAVPILNENGLCLTHEIRVGRVSAETGEVGDDIMLTHLWHSESGESLSTEHRLLLRDKSPQSYGSAITYARRYSLQLLVAMVSGDEDDDGENAQSPFRRRKLAPVDPPAPPSTAPEPSQSQTQPESPSESTGGSSGHTHNWALHLSLANGLCRDLGVPKWTTLNRTRQGIIAQSFRKWFSKQDSHSKSADEIIEGFWDHASRRLKTVGVTENAKLETLLRSL